MNKYIKLLFIILLLTTYSYGKYLENISVQLNWKYQFEFAGFIAAKEKGFYKQHGLNVQLKEYKSGIDIVEEVLKGRSTFGISNSTVLFVNYLKNKPIALVSSILKKSALVIVTKPYIKKPQDLVGKTLMATNDDIKDLFFMFSEQHIDRKKIKVVSHSFDIKDFIDGKVDAMSAYRSDQLYKLDKAGVKYNIIDPSDYGVYALQSEVFTTKYTIQHNHKMVQNFTAATVKGWKYALKHKDEIIDIILKKYTNRLTKDELQHEANLIEKFIFVNKYKIGSIDKAFLERQFIHLKEHLKKEHNITSNQVLNNFLYEKDKDSSVLSQYEIDYLKKKKVLTICAKKDWLPYEDIKNGHLVGISADFLNLYKKKLGVSTKLIVSKHQVESLRDLKLKKCDIKPVIITTKPKSIPYKPTIGYFSDTISVVTRLEQGYIRDLNDVKKPLLIVRGFKMLFAYIQEHYPNIKLNPVKDTQTALKMVADSKAFGYIGTSLNSSYVIQKEFSSELKIVNSFQTVHFGFGIVEDEPVLLNIMNKVIKNTTQKEKNDIFNKWIAATVEKQIDWKIVLIVAFVLVVFVSVIIFFLIREQKFNKELQKKVDKAIKDTRLAEQQLREQAKLAQMGEMISMIAHQWRQPLAAIGSINTALEIKTRMGVLDDKIVLDFTKSISKYLEHLSSTIDDFRNFFKPTKQKSSITYNELINDTLKIIEIYITSSNIELKKELNSNVVFDTYPNELKQVLLNLIKNSRDILIEKNIENPYIKIETDEMFLKVSDNGGGVPEDLLDKIFDPYFSTKSDKNGTGLGLYMSKTIVEEHCLGILSVENGKDGAIFTIELKK